jgi:2-oxo-4-hydroxy-4-carboxy--5-ureidoimidazoline (OHCU) decarboxylase
LKNNYTYGRPNEQKPFEQKSFVMEESKPFIPEQKSTVFEHKPFVMEELKQEQKFAESQTLINLLNNLFK